MSRFVPAGKLVRILAIVAVLLAGVVVDRTAVPGERDDYDILGRTAGLKLHEGGHDSVAGSVPVHQQRGVGAAEVVREDGRLAGASEINTVGMSNGGHKG